MAAIVLLSGSPSPKSRSAALLNYAAARLNAAGLKTVQFGLTDFPAEDLVLGRYGSAAFEPLTRQVADAPALVVCTPIYKAAYSGGLKTVLDMLPQTALRGKTVLPLATAGSPAHQLAIDYALKPVLSALGATDVLQGVYLIDALLKVREDGSLDIDPELHERLDRSIDRLAAAAKGRSATSI